MLDKDIIWYISPWTLCTSDYGTRFYHSDLKISLESKHVKIICDELHVSEESFYRFFNLDMFDAKRIQEIVDSIVFNTKKYALPMQVA